MKILGEYSVEEIAPAVYAIDTDAEESCYLLCGSKKTVMIDTGSAVTPLDGVLNAIEHVGQPELLLTHAHFDHMYHADAFAKVSLHENERRDWYKGLNLAVWAGPLGSEKRHKHHPLKHWHMLHEGDVISLGDKELKVLNAFGHTPGSVIFVDEADRLLFTGDAFGSGSYAWMWMPGCSCVSAYRRSLEELLEKLKPYRYFRMLGGHRVQGLHSEKYPEASELNYETVQDMAELCARLLGGALEPVHTEKNYGIKTYHYRYKKAAIVLTKQKIR